MQAVQNLLYRRPELYEKVYPEPDQQTPSMCRRMIERCLAAAPKSILDIGCGTGRDLATLCAWTGAEGWGIDLLPEMIAYAKGQHPGLNFQVGDMRTVCLHRTFDLVLCMGSALMYALSNQDLMSTIGTFSKHAHEGTLLIVDINNAAGYLGGGCFKEVVEGSVHAPEFTAAYTARHEFDRRQQRLIRRRTWTLAGTEQVEDYCEYRLLFPLELEYLLASKAFKIAGMWDNMELNPSDLSGKRLYAAAIAEVSHAKG